MSLFRRPVEERAISATDLWGAALPSESSSDPLRLIPLYSAVTGIADDVSVTPWHCYRDSGAGWGRKIDKQPRLLPDPTGTGLGFIPWMNQAVTSAALWGFAFAPILQWDSTGPSVARWAHPGRVDIDETGTSPVFRIDGRAISEYIYVPGPVLPGSIRGLSPTALFRMQFGKSLNAQRYASELFQAGVMPPGVLRNSKKVIVDTKGNNNMLYLPLDRMVTPQGTVTMRDVTPETTIRTQTPAGQSQGPQDAARARGTR